MTLEPSTHRKRAYVRRTEDPRFNSIQPGQKLGPVDLPTAKSFVANSIHKGWSVWRRQIAPGQFEVGRES